MTSPVRRAAVAVAGALLPAALLTVLAGAAPAHAASDLSYAGNGAAVSTTMRAAVRALPVNRETPAGYDRDLFPTWTDQDHDCRDTRAEVLQAESKVKVSGGCTIRTGRWVDWYDDTTYLNASQLDIDHLVPLAEVWASGGKKWLPRRREAYANDLADPRTLVAVSLHANRSKGDQEPDEWLPVHHACRYVASWVAVKTRWRLAIDSAEKADLLQMATHCGNPRIRTHLAVVRTSGGSAGSGGGGSTGGGSGSSGTDPRFPTCTALHAAGYAGHYVKGVDPEYYWYEDRDGDGVDCE